MAVRVIKKSLAGSEDLLLGFGTELQVRNDKNIEITKINASNIPYDENTSIADNITKKVDTISALRSMTETFDTMLVSGYHIKGDGAFGSNIFEWDSTSTEDDNGGTITKVDSVETGRYKLRYDGAINVKWFGAKGDGVTDDTIAIQKAFLLGKNIIYGRYSYKISESIPITSNMTVDSYGAVISWAGSSATPVYTITAPASEINIKGGLYTGTSGAWLYALGVSENPTSINDYARFKVKDVHVDGSLLFIDAQKAARFKIHSVQTYTANGINMNGKIVETKISDSVIFGSTAGVGTYGIKSKLYNGAATSSYPEGLHITNSTIDNFERTLEIYDIFVMTVTNSYIGDITNDKLPIYIKKGNSTHCREITFSGNTISGGIEFDAITAGNQYNAIINSNNFIKTNNVSIYLKSNTQQVKIDGNKFNDSSAPIDGFAVFANDNVRDIDVTNNMIDNTYTKIFQTSGLNGSNITVENNTSSISNPIFASRPIKAKNNGILNDIQSVQLTGTVTSGNYWASSINVSFDKGQKYLLIINAEIATTTTGYLQLELPSGLETLKGSGWNDNSIYIGSNPLSTKASRVFPIYTNSNGTGVIRLKNSSITSVTINYHSVMSLTII